MTVNIKPVPRTTLDDWPLDEVGLPVRAVRASRGLGLRTVGQLRGCPDEKLLKRWGFGRKTLADVHNFFVLCERIEQGAQTFRCLREVFELLLRDEQRDILYARFRLDAPASDAPWKRATLQALSLTRNITRERVRQIEKKALEALQSRPAQVCLDPFYAAIAARLEQHEYVVDATLLKELQSDPLQGGWQPAGVLALMAKVNPARLQLE